MTSVSTINSTSFANYSIDEPKKPIYWTSAKIRQMALYLFTALLSVGAIIGACLSSSPFDLLTVLPVLLSIYIGHKTYKIKDYEHPSKLKLYQEEAPSLNFDQLVEKHGLKNIAEYKILPPEAFKEKFNQQVQTKDFSSVLNNYDVEELLANQIATPAHIALLRNFKTEADQYRAEYDAYPSNNIAKGRAEYHHKMAQLEERYNLFKQTLVRT